MEAPAVTPLISSVGDPAQIREQVNNPNLSEGQRLGLAARQFESVLLNLFLKDAMKPILHQMPGSQGSGSVYQHYMTSVLADSISQAGGFGFSSVIQQQLTRQSDPSSPPSEHEG